MEVKVHSIHFDADRKLIDFVKEKISKLNVFYDNILASEAYLRIDKSDDFRNKVAEIRILIPGKEMFARKKCKSFEEATHHATEALRRQVDRKKGKLLQVY